MTDTNDERLYTAADMGDAARLGNAMADRAGAPAAPVEPCELMTAADAVEIPCPDPVISLDHADFSAAVCSVGEPAILTGAGSAGKGWYALLLAIAAAKGAAAGGRRPGFGGRRRPAGTGRSGRDPEL